MNIQDAAIIADVLTRYVFQFPHDDAAGKDPIAKLMEQAFPKYQWRWDILQGRYEVLMPVSETKYVKGVLEARKEEPPAGNGSLQLDVKQLPFSFQPIYPPGE